MHYGHWDETTRTLAQALRRQNELLARTACLSRSDRVLDAGCGVGGSAIFMAREVGCRVTGITISTRQAERALRNGQKHGVAATVNFAVMDFVQTGFAGGTFDVVWALESSCYAANKGAFVREAHRLLRPGGRLIVADGFASRTSYSGSDAATMQSWLTNWAMGSLETVDGFGRHLRRAGFSNTSFVDSTVNVLPSARRLYLLSLVALPIGRLAQHLGLRTAWQTRNILGCRHQYRAFQRALVRYTMVYAEKVGGGQVAAGPNSSIKSR